MGTLRSISGMEYLKDVTLEEAKQKMVEKLDSYYPSNNGNENYFTAPFSVEEDRYLFSDNGRAVQKKCASFETVLVFRDSTRELYRRFIYRP
jgi:hypothetical protein